MILFLLYFLLFFIFAFCHIIIIQLICGLCLILWIFIEKTLINLSGHEARCLYFLILKNVASKN